MRDTVYSILLEEQRSDMHHKVAKFIENSVSNIVLGRVKKFSFKSVKI